MGQGQRDPSRRYIGKLVYLTLCDQPRDTHKGRVDQRLSHTSPATFGRDQGRINQPHAEPALCFGDE